MSLSSDEQASYRAIIDSILKGSDLASVSAKQVRKDLAAQLGRDITHQKEAVNTLIGQRFDAISAKVIEAAEPVSADNSHANGVIESIESTEPTAIVTTSQCPPKALPTKRSAPSDESELSDVKDTPKPKKKQKQVAVEDDDAAFAARLQDEENRLARPTRGGGTKKRAPVKGVPKKKKTKSAVKVKDEDDSSKESGSETEPKERKGGFHKPMNLSAPLSELLGETQLSRPQTVKKIWQYVKARDLQDPSDKRQIRCDDAMRNVFKSDRVHMFTMNKILNKNLYAVDE